MIIKAYDILCPISIMSFISFCETLLNESKAPFTYISFRTLDVMLKIVAFSDLTELANMKLDANNMVTLYNKSHNMLEDEELAFLEQYPDSDSSEIEKTIRNAIIHITNHQFVKIPDDSIIANWMRLDYILNVIEPKKRSEILKKFPASIEIKTIVRDLVGSSFRNVYYMLKDLKENLLLFYNDCQPYTMLKSCTTEDQYNTATIQIIDTILQQLSASTKFLNDISQLMASLESSYNLQKLMSSLSQLVSDLSSNYNKHYFGAKNNIPSIKPTSYRYESPLSKHPLVQFADYRIIPSFFDLFACLKEFPIRFNEYLENMQNENVRNTMGLLYEYYIGDLLEYTLDTERYIIIPEFAYKRGRSEVRSPDFVVLDKQDRHVYVIEVKGTRTSNLVRDDPASLGTQEFVKRMRDVLSRTLTKIDDLFACVGDYSENRDDIRHCDRDKTTILFVQKDFGVLIPSLIHFELAKLDPTVSEECCSFNYCLIDIPNLEKVLHNYKDTGKPITNYLREYHQVQIGKINKPVPILGWIPIEYNFKSLIYVDYQYNQTKKEV